LKRQKRSNFPGFNADPDPASKSNAGPDPNPKPLAKKIKDIWLRIEQIIIDVSTFLFSLFILKFITHKTIKIDGEQRRYLKSALLLFPVKPAFEEFCIPTKKYADVIVPRGADNIVAIDLIVQHIRVNISFFETEI
jgi:hypothetical protein